MVLEGLLIFHVLLDHVQLLLVVVVVVALEQGDGVIVLLVLLFFLTLGHGPHLQGKVISGVHIVGLALGTNVLFL